MRHRSYQFIFVFILTCRMWSLGAGNMELSGVSAGDNWEKLWSFNSINPFSRQPREIHSNYWSVTDDLGMVAHNMSVQLGGTAYLVCRVGGVESDQISWVRRRDWHILSSGTQVFTNDARFGITHQSGSHQWTMHIQSVQRRDQGMYECQVSTASGVISQFVNLQVIIPEAFILGTGELHADMGSPIELICIIGKGHTPPQYVHWAKDGELINYSESRHDISISTTFGTRTQSQLSIGAPRNSDSGNYTCSTSNTEPASILVFVSKDDNTAAISRRNLAAAEFICGSINYVLGFGMLLNWLSARRIGFRMHNEAYS